MLKKFRRTKVIVFLMFLALAVSNSVVESPTADFVSPVITFSNRILTVEDANSMTQEEIVEYFNNN